MKSVRKTRDEHKPPRAAAPKDRDEPATDAVDHREQLANEGLSGPVEAVSLPTDMITSLRGIALDVDPKWIRPELFEGGKGSPGYRLYKRLVADWLEHDPLFAKAQVRHTGSGLHILFWFATPVEFESAGDRQRWEGVIRALQCVLPTDPTAPGITALTRPVGSTNSKTGKEVKLLHPGEPVSAEEVIEFFARLRAKPFRTIARLLFGAERIDPCPICQKEGRVLAALDRAGQCYGGCGTVSISRLLGAFMVKRTDGED